MERLTGYATVGSLNLYYEVYGTGRPLVVLHGGILTIESNFGALIPSLAQARQVIGVELQGHGHTADVDREMSLANHADDVAALLSQLGIDRADLFGFSLGGLTALTMALRHPERAGKLVLVSIDHRPGRRDPEDPPPMEGPDDPRMPTAADFQAMQDDYVRVAPDPGHFEEFFARNTEMIQALDGWTDDDLRSIRSPTLVIAGDNDFVPVRHALEMSRLIPNAQLAVLPGTTHMDLIRSPRRLAALLLPFLADDNTSR